MEYIRLVRLATELAIWNPLACSFFVTPPTIHRSEASSSPQKL